MRTIRPERTVYSCFSIFNGGSPTDGGEVMDVTELAERVHDFGRRAQDRAPHLKTEEATKAALVMPFLREILGYNPNDPTEVVPEFVADFGIRQGEKVDYAILRDGKPIMLLECKKYGAPLANEQTSQLFRYFDTTEAQFGILTDGVSYRFFSDLDRPNRLDDKPFLEINLLDTDAIPFEELLKFVKSEFDADEIRATANDLKYTTEIKRVLAEEWGDPSEEFVRFFASRVYSGTKTKARMEQFASITKNALQQFLRDKIRQRVTSALEQSEDSVEAAVQLASGAVVETPETGAEESAIVTTEAELSGYYAVKAILHDTIDVRRVALRDAKSYAAVLLDNTNRKVVCRLWFNGKQKYLGVLDTEKNETRIPIDDVDDIFTYADQIRATAAVYPMPG